MIGAALAALAVPASAQDKTFTLKLSHWVPATHPLQKAMEEWGASVEKASNGTIKSNVYPAQQLGKAPDHYDMTRDGIVDLSYVNPGFQPGRFPIVSAGELPFLVGEAHGGIRAVDTWYRKYGPAEMKDVKLCFSFILDPLRMHSRNKKVVVPSDVKGMKIRPSHATMASWVTQLGGTNVTSGPSEIRDLMEKGVADATTSPYGSVLLFGIDKVSKYHLEIPLATTTFQWIMNQRDLRRDVGVAEEGNRRSLHHGLGREVRRSLGRLRSRRHHQAARQSGARDCFGQRRPAQGMEGCRRSRSTRPGPIACAKPAATPMSC